MPLLDCLLTSLCFRLSAKLREGRTEEKDCVKIFKDSVAYFADIPPVLARKPKDIVTLGAFVRLAIPSREVSTSLCLSWIPKGQGKRQNTRNSYPMLEAGAIKVSDKLSRSLLPQHSSSARMLYKISRTILLGNHLHDAIFVRLRCINYRLLIRGNTVRIDHKDVTVLLYDIPRRPSAQRGAARGQYLIVAF